MVAYHIHLHSKKILFCATSAMSARGLPSLGYSFGALHQVYLSHNVMLKILNIRYRWQSFNTLCMQFSFKFLSPTHRTRHLCVMSKGYMTFCKLSSGQQTRKESFYGGQNFMWLSVFSVLCTRRKYCLGQKYILTT